MRSFRELRWMFRDGRIAWPDLSSEELARLTEEQGRVLRDLESDVLERPDRDNHGYGSVRAYRGVLPEGGRRR